MRRPSGKLCVRYYFGEHVGMLKSTLSKGPRNCAMDPKGNGSRSSLDMWEVKRTPLDRSCHGLQRLLRNSWDPPVNTGGSHEFRSLLVLIVLCYFNSSPLVHSVRSPHYYNTRYAYSSDRPTNFSILQRSHVVVAVVFAAWMCDLEYRSTVDHKLHNRSSVSLGPTVQLAQMPEVGLESVSSDPITDR